MPMYEYEYTREDGSVVQIVYPGSMETASEPIEVVDKEDGNRYIATRIMSLTADMSYSWSDDVRNSDLPPVNYTPEDVKRDLAKKKRRSKKKNTARR